jgi:hypothetical protein
VGEEEEEERRFLSGPTEAQYAFGEKVLRGMGAFLFFVILGNVTNWPIVRPNNTKKGLLKKVCR